MVSNMVMCSGEFQCFLLGNTEIGFKAYDSTIEALHNLPWDCTVEVVEGYEESYEIKLNTPHLMRKERILPTSYCAKSFTKEKALIDGSRAVFNILGLCWMRGIL